MLLSMPLKYRFYQYFTNIPIRTLQPFEINLRNIKRFLSYYFYITISILTYIIFLKIHLIKLFLLQTSIQLFQEFCNYQYYLDEP